MTVSGSLRGDGKNAAVVSKRGVGMDGLIMNAQDEFWKDGRFYIVEHSHSDIAWTYSIEGEAAVRNRNLAEVFNRMREDDSFKWTIECVLYLQNWIAEHPETEPELLAWFHEGRLDCGATFTQPLEDCLYDELLVRQMYFGKRWFEKRFPGINLAIVLNQDGPLRGHQAQQIYAKAGVRFLKGSRMQTPGFFRWSSPDGSFLTAWFQEGYWGKPDIDADYLAGQLESRHAFYLNNKLPPVLGLTWGWDYNDPVDLNAIIADWNRDAVGKGRLPVAYGTFADVLREVERHGMDFQEIKGGVPNWWIYEAWPSHVRAMQQQRTAAKLLPMAEIFQTVKALLSGGFRDYPSEALTQAWAEASFTCHTMVSAPQPAPDVQMGEKYRRAAETGRRQTLEALDWIAKQIEPTREGTPVVAFNGLAWARTDPVSVDLPAGLAMPVRLLDEEGHEIPYQVSSGRLVFIARNVPPIGYRTYTLSAKKSAATGSVAATGMEPAVGEIWTAPFESDHYCVTPGIGGVASIIDKEFGKELLSTGRWQGGEWVSFGTDAMGACEGIDFNPHPETFSDRAANHKPEWICRESGPVLVRWTSSEVRSAHCRVTTSVSVYRNLKRIDWAVRVTGNDDQIHVEQRLMFPVKTSGSEIAYGVPFGVVKPGVSEPFVFVNKNVFSRPETIPAHPREIQDWVNVVGDGVGITIGSSSGACAFRDFGPGAEFGPVISPILLACIANPDGKSYRQPGDFDFAFSLFSHPVGWAHGRRLGVQSQNQILAVIPAGGDRRLALAPTGSFFVPDGGNTGISAIKKAEDDDSVVMRFHDLEGRGGDIRVCSSFRILDAQRTSLIERDGRPLTSTSKAFILPVKPWGIETVKARLEFGP